MLISYIPAFGQVYSVKPLSLPILPSPVAELSCGGTKGGAVDTCPVPTLGSVPKHEHYF